MKQTLIIALKQVALDVVTSEKFREGVNKYIVAPVLNVADAIKRAVLRRCK